jgi:hypothetical protein
MCRQAETTVGPQTLRKMPPRTVIGCVILPDDAYTGVTDSHFLWFVRGELCTSACIGSPSGFFGKMYRLLWKDRDSHAEEAGVTTLLGGNQPGDDNLGGAVR